MLFETVTNGKGTKGSLMSDTPRKRSGGLSINSPGAVHPLDPTYFLQCSFALEPSVEGLIELAVEAGWSRKEVVIAIIFIGMECLGIRVDGTDAEDIFKTTASNWKQIQ